jgi:FkbM family methyltransferase
VLPRTTPLRRRLPGGAVLVAPNLAGWGGRGVFVLGAGLEPELALVPLLVHPGDTVIDVGANSGLYTLEAATRVGPGGTVVALEPNPDMTAVLRANIERNRLAAVRVRPLAAAEAPGPARLYENLGRPNAFGLTPRHPDTPWRPVTTVTLDQLAADEGLGPVHLVKVDAEGAEDRVLAGAAGLLARWRPAVVAEVTRGGLGTVPRGYRALVAPRPGPNHLLMADGDPRQAAVRALGWRAPDAPG